MRRGSLAELAEGLGARVAAWLSGRSTGRVLDGGALGRPRRRGRSARRARPRRPHGRARTSSTIRGPRCARRSPRSRTTAPPASTRSPPAALLERLPDPAEALRELARHLRPGGTILLSVANIGHWYPRTLVASGPLRLPGPRRARRGEPPLLHPPLAADPVRRHRPPRPTLGGPWLVTSADPAPAPGRWSARADAVGLTVAPSLFTASWLVEVAPD